MRLFGFNLSFSKAAPVSASPASLSGVDGGGSWIGDGWSRMFGGMWLDGWQQDVEVKRDAVVAQATVFSCITLIASDSSKVGLRIQQKYGRVWLEKTTPGYTDLLDAPNKYQTRQQFVEQWIISKLSSGNTYVLLDRDRKTKRVVGMYVLDPHRVTPLVAPDGSVYYQLQEDDLARVTETLPAVPASEVIHDRFNCLFHPLVGLSPIFASGLAATQALQIQQNSAKFFKNQSRPSGIITAPTKISDDAARRIKEYWEANYQGANKIGSVAVLGDGLTYAPNGTNAVDAQLVEQLKISAAQVCATFHVPAYMVGAASEPTYSTTDAKQRYYDQCLHALIEAAEACLDKGLGLGVMEDMEGKPTLRTNFDLDDLLRMDQKTMTEVEGLKVQRSITSPNEAREKFGLMPVKGGESPRAQHQEYTLEALAARDSGPDPFGKAQAPAPSPAPAQAASAPADASKVAEDALRIVKEAEAQERAQRAEQQAAEAAQALAAAEARAQQAEVERAAALAQREAERIAAAAAATLAREQEAARIAEVERQHAARLAEQEAVIRREAEAAAAAQAVEAQQRAAAATLDAERRAADTIAAAQRDATAAIASARAETAAGMEKMVAAVDQRMLKMLEDATAARAVEAAARAAEQEAARVADATAAEQRAAEARATAAAEEQSAKAFADLLMAEFTDA